MRSDNSKIKEIFKDLSFSADEIKIIESVFHKAIYKKGDIIMMKKTRGGRPTFIAFNIN